MVGETAELKVLLLVGRMVATMVALSVASKDFEKVVY